jgi:PAS domain S-box-containing protein
MQFDPRTAIATMGVLALVYTGLATIVQWTGRTYSGYRRWLCAGLMTVLSLFLLNLRPNLPDWITIIIANSVLGLASILHFEGAREFRGLSPRLWLVYVGGVVTIVGLAFFRYVIPSLNARAALMSAFLAAVFLLGAITLLNAIPTTHRLGLRLSGVLFALCSATHVVRAVYCAFGPPLGDAFAFSAVNGTIFVALSVQISLFPIGFILLADERAIAHLKDAQNQAWSVQESLGASEERLRLATQGAGIGVFDADILANRSVWSPELCSLLGVPVGTTGTLELAVDRAHPDDRARFVDAINATIDPKLDGKFSGEFRFRTGTGETRWIATTCQTFFEGTGAARRAVRTTGVMLDITDRKLREANDRFLSELGAVWALEHDVADLVRTVANAVALHLDANIVTLSAITSDAVLVSVDCLDSSANTIPDSAFHLLNHLTGEALADLVRGTPVVVNDVTTDPRTAFAQDQYFKQNSRAVVIVPLLSGGILKAILRVHSASERPWRSDEVMLLENVAARLWPAVERARTEEALRRSEERHEFLLRLSDALRPLTDALEMQEAASRLLGEHLQVNRVSYADIDGDDFVILFSYTKGVAPFVGRVPLATFGARLQEAYRRGEPIAVDDVRKDPRFTEPERARLLANDIAAFAGVMLLKAGQWVGAFGIHNATPRVWTPGELDLLRDVGERTWDAIQRATAEAAFRSAEERFRAFFANSPTVAWVKDEEGRHVYASPTYEERFGVKQKDWLGKTDFDLWPKTVAEQFWKNDYLVLAANEPLEVLESAPNPDGTISWWLSNKFPFSDAAGRRYLGGIALDVTDRKVAEEALRESDRRKNEFLATLAHELRNPLAALSMGLQLARRKNEMDPALKHSLQMMDRQLGQLVRLVDDLLDIGRISAGKIELHLDSIKLSEVLTNSLEEVRATLESRGHDVRFQIQPGPHRVRGDSARLTQVLANLIENAAKYTKPGGRIRVSLSQENRTEVVRVEDNGIGIPSDELTRVFDLFSQLRVHQGMASEGLGIGLSIVRKLVELHGGTVNASSAGLGHGSTFTVCLPALDESISSQSPEIPSQVATKRTPHGRRVLIVDDNEDVADALADYLGQEGHETCIARDGLQAVEIVKSKEFDVAFIDLGMPKLDGVETAKRIRALLGDKRMRMAALTGWGHESDRARTRAAGFDWHLVKPVNPELLSEIVATLEPMRVE